MKTKVEEPLAGSLTIALAQQAVFEAATHHYTAHSAGPNPDCNHRHFMHRLGLECEPYADALDALVNIAVKTAKAFEANDAAVAAAREARG